jgi:hypothetical protein
MWDDYGDGWNGGYVDIYINGQLAVQGVTLESSPGPEMVVFSAETGDLIETVWVAGGWPYEASYCVQDGPGNALGCDGLDGAEPTGITAIGNCETP